METTSTKIGWNMKPFAFLFLFLVIKAASVFAQTNCNAHFIFYNSNLIPGQVYFAASQNPPHTRFVWDFGDGTGSNHSATSHLYSHSGAFTVCLTVTDSSAGNLVCTATWCDTVHITLPPPVCNANFVYFRGANPLNIHFTPGGNPPGTTYAWNFGDNTTSFARTPSHTYAQSGTYYACLTVTDSVGGTILCSDTWCDSIRVSVPLPVCNAHFNHSQSNSHGEVDFYGPANPPGTTYTWNFGDNTTSTGHSPDHTYTQSGTFYACLTVTDSIGGTILCSNTWCDSIHVVIPPPVCNAHYHFSHGTSPLNLNFYASNNPAGSVYAWDFGDGTTGSGHSTNHAFAQFGTYHVCLTVTDSSGGNILCSANWCDSIHVVAPVCNAEFDHSCGHHGMNIHFEPEQEHHSSFAWDFGDNSTSSQSEPTHIYAQPGAYNVCLTVTDSVNGNLLCTATWCDTLFAGRRHGGCHSHHGHDTHRFGSGADVTDTDEMIAMIYPNPVSESSVLHLENTTGDVTFRIFESTGRLVMTRENLTDGDIQLDRNNFVQGLYFFTINDDNGNVTNGKFIVQ